MSKLSHPSLNCISTQPASPWCPNWAINYSNALLSSRARPQAGNQPLLCLKWYIKYEQFSAVKISLPPTPTTLIFPITFLNYFHDQCVSWLLRFSALLVLRYPHPCCNSSILFGINLQCRASFAWTKSWAWTSLDPPWTMRTCPLSLIVLQWLVHSGSTMRLQRLTVRLPFKISLSLNLAYLYTGVS